MSKAKRTALVTGASGLAGGYMLAHLLERGGWDIVAVSRRKPRIPGDFRHIAVDLLDPADCRTKLGPLTNISHLLFLYPSHQRDTAHRPIGTGRLRVRRRFGYWGEQIGHLRDQSGQHFGGAPAELEPATAGWFRNGYGNVASTGRPATDR
jgi:NAD dependent epimerase/dehydratase family